MRTKEEIENEIREAGGDILVSDIFVKGFEQSHHFRSNISDHALHVTKTALRMAGLFDSVDRTSLIRGCLCHDLGLIYNRGHVYTTGRQCITQHPLDSIERAEKIIGELNDTEKDVILYHMFPLITPFPRTKEGVIISIVDKYCALYEPFTVRSSSVKLHERLHIPVKKMA